MNMSILRSTSRLVLVAALLLITAHRLPAPIQELPESPTPAPENQTKPKKTQARSNAVESEPKIKSAPKPSVSRTLQGPAQFAGTWKGKVNQGLLGHVQTTLIVDPTATSIELSHNLGGGKRPSTANGNTISWKTGVVGEVAWTLTPNSDGQTAQVTMKGLLLNDATTFRRALAPEKH